ncbi:hypothetical protein OU995_11785 [Roseateles sp. SL47]|uniref:hypothetical protein n=1 Tax=Roseateles sp. SL47 TaxID=2995138 RepID=UPI00226E36CE|nr:hypothetical protein [Roseateles sp. SL47]WAC75329.1 hypothetical protein OU995_11785 [Roseateles sp. SL47]
MPEKSPPAPSPVTIQAEIAQVGYTADGAVNFQPQREPPESVAIRCQVPECGTLNWPHETVCRGCGYDSFWWVTPTFRVCVLILLLLILLVQLWSATKSA